MVPLLVVGRYHQSIMPNASRINSKQHHIRRYRYVLWDVAQRWMTHYGPGNNKIHGHIIWLAIIMTAVGTQALSPWSLDKIEMWFLERKFLFWLKFQWIEGSIDHKSSLVQAMAWCLFGTKPLPEPMMSLVTDAYLGLRITSLKKAAAEIKPRAHELDQHCFP